MKITKSEKQPLVFVQDGEVFASSRDVAEMFEKQHKNVLRDIGNIQKSLKDGDNLCALNFELTSVEEAMPNGGVRKINAYNMTRDGFTLLAMGFTGEHALKFKLAYIEAFNKMEKEIHSKANDVPSVNVRDPSYLATISTQLIEYTKELEAEKQQLREEVEEIKPKALALDRIANAEGTMNITSAAKHLQQRPMKFISFISSMKWIFKRAGAKAWMAYQDKIQAGYLIHKTYIEQLGDGTEIIREQVRFTPKGLAKMAEIIEEHLKEIGELQL